MLANGIYHTMDWEELNHGLFTALRIQQIVMSLVLALIIVVAAFTVIATLIMVVLDKKKEIAVLKAMGATDSALLRSFLYQGGDHRRARHRRSAWRSASPCARGSWSTASRSTPRSISSRACRCRCARSSSCWSGMFAIVRLPHRHVWPALYAARLRPAEAFREQQ